MRIGAFTNIALPEPLHFITGTEQVIECPFGFDSAVLEHNDVVCSLERGTSVRYYKAGGLVACKHPFPQDLFRLDIQCAGEIIEH